MLPRPHGDLFGRTAIDDQCADLARFVRDIFDGKCLLVEFFPRDGEPTKFVEDDLESFLQSLGPGETYKVHNHPRRVY